MSPARAGEMRWRGLDALTLENAAIRATIVPSMGGHVAELIDRGADRDVLWHNPRATPRPAPYGAHFDDWWSGGWDEIFPSGDASRLHGEPLPYMGELWCTPSMARPTMDLGGASASIETDTFGTVAAARFTRRLTLVGDEPVLHVHYRIENLDVRPLRFTWGIHPSFEVGGSHRIEHPATTMLVGASSSPELGEVGMTYAWPWLPDPTAAGGRRDVSMARERKAAVFGGHWATDLPEGWLALTDTVSRRGVAIVFDPGVFRHAWLWQVYGGWRGHQHVALEPWTSLPMDLESAIPAGSARTLDPGEVLETDVGFAFYSNDARAQAVERVGERLLVR